MKCPTCEEVELVEETHSEIHIDRCPQCKGIWFDRKELESLLAAAPPELLAADSRYSDSVYPVRSDLKCPRCLHQHLLVIKSKVLPETDANCCGKCFGAWLDAGELTRISKTGFGAWMQALFLH